MIELIIVGIILFTAWTGLWYFIFTIVVQHNAAKRASLLAKKQQLLRSGVKRV